MSFEVGDAVMYIGNEESLIDEDMIGKVVAGPLTPNVVRVIWPLGKEKYGGEYWCNLPERLLVPAEDAEVAACRILGDEYFA